MSGMKQSSRTKSRSSLRTRRSNNQTSLAYRTPETASLGQLTTGGKSLKLNFMDVVGLAKAMKDGNAYELARQAFMNGPEYLNLGKKAYNAVKSLIKPSSNSASNTTSLKPKVVENLDSAERKELRSLGLQSGTPPMRNLVKQPRVKSTQSGSHSHGTDLIATITATKDYKAGDVIYAQQINPIHLPKRIKEIASKWELYHLWGSIKLQGACGTNVSGQTVAFIDYDPADSLLSNSTINVSIATAHEGSKIGALYEGSEVRINRSNEPQRLYVDNDTDSERFTSVGTYYLICSQPIVNGSPIGTLTISWEMINSIPQVEDSITSGDIWYMACTGSATTSNFFPNPSYPIPNTFNVEINSATGYLTLPAGIYSVSISMLGCSGVTIGGVFGLSVSNNGKKDPLLFADQSWANLEANNFMQVDLMCACVNSFKVRLNVTAGTWNSLRVKINAMSSSPVSSSMRTFVNLMNKADSARKQTSNIARLNTCVVTETPHDEDSKEFLRPFVVPSSTSSSSSNSSSSSSSLSSLQSTQSACTTGQSLASVTSSTVNSSYFGPSARSTRF